METKQMTDEQMQQFVAENIDIVPSNQRSRFELYPIDKQVDKIMFYRSTNMNMTPEAIIDDCFERNDKSQLIIIFGIQSTKSIKALNLLNDIAKEHNYKYELWYASQGSASSMHMTIDQLLKNFNK